MNYEVTIVNVAPQPLAAIPYRCAQSELSSVIPRLCGEVWEFVRASKIENPGRLIALYRSCNQGILEIEVGVEVTQPFADGESVRASQTPGGTVATLAHFGGYDKLGAANEALHTWCMENGYTTTGTSWEVYGHWDEDETKLRTDIFYRIEKS